ncbi:MAG: glycosyltransferase, partial [Clostridia bacterium]|nr:glycosyltransferase [Clostridia bacterium]
MKNLISVIVPIYKVEKYLRECVDSLLCQTYTNLEIILVDDGSPDNCPVICDEYAVKDSRVKVLHKENGGVQSAVKCGVKSSQGEYIAFVDGDDYVSEDYIQNLINPLINNDYDLVMSGFNTDTNGIINSIQIDKTGEQIIDNEYLKNLLQIKPFENVKITNSRCGKLFKRELLLSVIDLVDERIFIGEDMLTIKAYATKCKKVFETGKNTYFYRMVETSS